MMRSLFSAVSGLQNHQTRMDVIGNNVANVNTTGFKKSRVTFQDILSQTITGAAKPTDVRGGLNPKQVGLGMNVASVDKIMSQGSIQTTGKNTDLAITGEGFFVMKKGDQTFFTRNGNFMIDKDGLLVNSNGMKVQGWNAQPTGTGEFMVDSGAPIEDVVVPISSKLAATPTGIVKFKSNLDGRKAVLAPNATAQEKMQNTWPASINVYDKYGNSRRMNVSFKKTALNQWQAQVNIEGVNPQDVKVDIGTAKVDTDNRFNLNFNTDGTILSAGEAAGQNPQVDADGELMANVSYKLPDGTTQSFKMKLGTVGDVRSSITQFSSNFSTKAYFQDGAEMSYLESFKIDDSGTITGTYENGEKRTLGQIALGGFVNASGLTKNGESLYTQSNNSGLANIGTAGTQGRGKVYAGALEMSNVDLSETFTNMIVTERGFQANSRVITTSDEMLREILGLKR